VENLTRSGGITNWIVSTIAGSGVSGSADGTGNDASFHFPTGITADSARNLYVSDAANFTIRQLSPVIAAAQTNWLVSTIAGTAGSSASADGTGAAARFGYPAGIVVGTGGKLSPTVANGQTNWVVSIIAGSAGQIGISDGVGGAARFTGPFAVTVDVADSLYVTDSGSDPIRQMSSSTTGGQSNWVVGYGDAPIPH